MGSSSSKQVKQQEVIDDKPKEPDPWDIAELSEYRLGHLDFERKLYEAINGYWEEVYVPGMDTTNYDENATEEDKDDDDHDSPLQNENNLGNNDKDLTSKVLFGNIVPGQKAKRRDLAYFTDEVYEEWSWTMYLDGHLGLFEKTGKYPPLFERAIYHFKVNFEKLKSENNKLSIFQYHSPEQLAKNEVHEFLWIFIGYQYHKAHKHAENHFMGEQKIWLDFLRQLSLSFKVIIIGYSYEQYQYKKVVNHYMKPCLANIDKPVLNYAQDIARKCGLKKRVNDNDDYNIRTMKSIYQTICNRIEGCRMWLSENGIEMKKTL